MSLFFICIYSPSIFYRCLQISLIICQLKKFSGYLFCVVTTILFIFLGAFYVLFKYWSKNYILYVGHLRDFLHNNDSLLSQIYQHLKFSCLMHHYFWSHVLPLKIHFATLQTISPSLRASKGLERNTDGEIIHFRIACSKGQDLTGALCRLKCADCWFCNWLQDERGTWLSHLLMKYFLIFLSLCLKCSVCSELCWAYCMFLLYKTRLTIWCT